MQLKIDEIFAVRIIPADDSVRLLEEITAEMDYTALVTRFTHTAGITKQTQSLCINLKDWSL